MVLTIHRSNYPFTSAWDEHSHLSYIQYMFEFKIPAPGNGMEEWAKLAFSCYPHHLYGIMTSAPCGEIWPGNAYPTGGTNTAEGWPPVYYFLTSLLMRIPFAFNENPLISARYATSMIWTLGIVVLSSWMLRQRIGRVSILSSLIILSALPISGYYSSFVSPYSTTPLLAGVGLILHDKFRTESNKGIVKVSIFFALYTIIASLTNPHFILGILIIAFAILLGLNYESQRLKENVSKVISLSAYPIASMATFKAWTIFQNNRIVPWPDDVNVSVQIFLSDAGYPNLKELIKSRLLAFWPGSFREIVTQDTIYTEIAILIITSVSLGLALRLFGQNVFKNIALATIIFGVLYSVFIEIYLAYPAASRYGFSVVIFSTLLLSSADKSRFAKTLIFLFAVILYVNAIIRNPIFTVS